MCILRFKQWYKLKQINVLIYLFIKRFKQCLWIEFSLQSDFMICCMTCIIKLAIKKRVNKINLWHYFCSLYTIKYFLCDRFRLLDIFFLTYNILNLKYLKNKESFIEYCMWLKRVGVDQIQLNGFMIDLITPNRIWSPHDI